MQLIIINITLCLFITVSSLRVYGQDLHPKLEISFNTNVELLGFCYFLSYEGIGIDQDTIEVDGEEMLRSEFHAYGFKIYQQYESFQNSDNMLSAMMVADHLWLDYIISILLRVESFPNASIPADMPPTTYMSFSKSKDLTKPRRT